MAQDRGTTGNQAPVRRDPMVERLVGSERKRRNTSSISAPPATASAMDRRAVLVLHLADDGQPQPAASAALPSIRKKRRKRARSSTGIPWSVVFDHQAAAAVGRLVAADGDLAASRGVAQCVVGEI